MSLAKRLVFALPLIGLGVIFFLFAPDGLGKVGAYMIGSAALLLGLIMLNRPLAGLLSQPMGSILRPGRRSSADGPNYTMPEAKAALGEFEEALTLYRELTEEYPQETRPWMEMLDIAVLELKSPSRAKQIYRDALMSLKKEREQAVIVQLYKGMSRNLGSMEEESKEEEPASSDDAEEKESDASDSPRDDQT